MKRHRFFIPILSLVFASFLVPSRAVAGSMLIDFEDATRVGDFIDPTYKGFQWGGAFGQSSWILGNTTLPPGSTDNSYPPAHSGIQYVYSNGGNALTLSDGTFDFNGMWAKAAVDSAHTMDVTVHAFRKDATNTEIEVGSTTIHVTSAYTQFAFSPNLPIFTNIDKITFDSYSSNLIIDDITVTTPNTAATPEPASLTLAAIGALGLAGYRLRQRKQTPAS